jgi:halimadienyl-diphosphate synthase
MQGRLSLARSRPARTQPAQIREEVRHLLQRLETDGTSSWNSGAMSSSAYDTAWVARVRDPTHPERLAFPASLAWLLRHQHADGHWGAPFPYSVLPSMAALLALRRAPPSSSIDRAANRALAYLQRVLPDWSLAACDTPYIEFLLPRLAQELAYAGVSLTVPDLGTMQAYGAAKMQAIPLETLYDGQSPLLHVLEAFGDRLDFRRLRKQQSPDGGYGSSPSATAAVLLYAPEWDQRAARWLATLARRSPDGRRGGVPTAFPAGIFEMAWSVFFLLEAGVDLDAVAPRTIPAIRAYLSASLGPTGACFGHGNGLPPDVDDTAMVIAVLRRLRLSPSLDALWSFQSGDHFATFAHERTSSPSANAHVLEALIGHHHDPRVVAARDQVVEYLYACQERDGTWHDKWSISPYYATMSCALALARSGDARARHHLDLSAHWVLESQQPDGGWGYAVSSPEETAYSLLILRRLAGILPQPEAIWRVVERGRAYLWRHLAALRDGPCLWVDKDLYRPDTVIRAAVLAALYDQM